MTVNAQPYLLPDTRIKLAGASKPYTIDFKAWLRSYWIAQRAYNANDYVRPPSVSGFAMQAGAAGEAGVTEPAWPRVLAGTVQDGSITWTAVAPGTNALDAISSVAWSQPNPPDSNLTISGQVNTNEEATATFVSGTQGQTYLIQCAVTTAAGKVYVIQFNLEIA